MRFYFRGIRVCWQMFGLSRDFMRCAMVIMIFIILSMVKTVTLFFDRIFFRKFRSIEVKQPVFIIGHPRSGTTFMHKLFTQTHEMAAYYSWHLLFPAISARIFVRPIVNFFLRRQMTTIFPESTGHHTAIDKVEEEELLFIHNLDTQFAIILSPMGFLENTFDEYRLHDLMPDSQRLRSARFLKSLFQRHIYYTGKKQIFAQTHFSTHRIKTLMEVFPDARFIYMHRMPEHTLPSYFTLIHNMLDQLWGTAKFKSDQIKKFYEYRYKACIDLYRYFYDLWMNNEIDKSRVLVISYDQLTENLMSVFESVVKFTEIEPTDTLRAAIKQQAEAQKKYQRAHEVRPLEDFGIDSHRLREDFAFLYNKDPHPYVSIAEHA